MTNQGNTKSNTQRQISKKATVRNDASFLALYFESNENQSEVARQLGINRAAVCRRIKKIGPERIEEAKNGGMTALAISRTVQTAQETQQVAFDRGVNVAATCTDTLIQLKICNNRIESFMAVFDNEVLEHYSNPENRIKLEHIAMLSALTRELCRVADTTHKIRKDLFSVDSVNNFMKATVDVMIEEIPDVRTKLYQRLTSGYGFGDQITALYPPAAPKTDEEKNGRA